MGNVFNDINMFEIINCILFFTFAFLISCAGKKKKTPDGGAGKIVKVGESVVGGKKIGRAKTKTTGSNSGVSGKVGGKVQSDNEKKQQQTPSTMNNVNIGKSKENRKTEQDLVPKKSTKKIEDGVKDSNNNVGGGVTKSVVGNCASAAPTQVNIFDQCDDPAADKMVLEKTQNTCEEDLKDGDDTLKNVYSLPIDKDQSLKVVEEAEGGRNSIKKANK